MSETDELDELLTEDGADEAGVQLGKIAAKPLGERLAAMVEREAAEAEAPEPAAPPHDPHTATCPDCQGFGQTQTGSRVEGQEFRECPGCTGRGWIELPPAPGGPAEPGDVRTIRRDANSGGWSWS